ncbi:MAG: hypothetical protein WCG27_02645 [Pseudomonadota bacterium]
MTTARFEIINGRLDVNMNLSGQTVLQKAAGFAFEQFVKPMGLWDLQEVYAKLQETKKTAPNIFQAVLDAFEVRMSANDERLAKVPLKNGLVIISNHPLPGMDALAIAAKISTVRPGEVKILANAALVSIPEIRDLIIPVDVFNPDNPINKYSVELAIRWVRQGHVLITTPRCAQTAVFCLPETENLSGELKSFCEEPVPLFYQYMSMGKPRSFSMMPNRLVSLRPCSFMNSPGKRGPRLILLLVFLWRALTLEEFVT